MKLLTLLLLFSFCIIGNAQLGKPAATPKNGNNSLGIIYDNYDCGLNFVQASRKVTSRNTGLGSTAGGAGSGEPCVLTIAGLPTCRIIDRAYIWFLGSFGISTVEIPINQTVSVTNPALVTANYTANVVGSDIAKCWVEDFSGTYRADVTAAISGNGNYSINFPGLQTADIDGATLFIIYKDLNVCTTKSRLMIKDGNITIDAAGGVATTTITGINPCEAVPLANVRAFALTSDFQLLAGGHNFNVGGASTNIANSFYNYDTKGVALAAGVPSLAYSLSGGGLLDCFALGMVGLYYTTSTSVACGGVCPNPFTLTATNTGPYCTGATINLNSSVTPAYSCSPTFAWTGPLSFSSVMEDPTRPSSLNTHSGTYTVTASFPGTCYSPIAMNTSVSVTTCLPIELSSFTGEHNSKKRQNELTWVTKNELDNDYFELEKSTDGNNWSVLGSIDGLGTSTTDVSYGFIDEEIINDKTSYYRLIQVDFNGDKKVSNPISIINESKSRIFFYPNPSEDNLFFTIPENETVQLIQIVSVDGKMVHQCSSDELITNSLQINQLEQGSYILITTTDKGVFKQSFEKLKSEK